MPKKCGKERENAGGTATCRGPPANIFGIVCILHSHSKGNPFLLVIFLKHFFKMAKKCGNKRDDAGDTATCRRCLGNIFGIVCILHSHSKGNPPSAGDFCQRLFFLMVKKCGKETDDAGAPLTCRGPLGNIFGIVCILHSHWKGNTHFRC